MPYKTIKKAKEGKFPTKIGKLPLSIGQINKLAKIYDSIKAGGGADNPMAVAIAQWKKEHTKKGGRWVKKKIKKESVSTSVSTNPTKGGEVTMDWESITLKELKENRPDLHEELRKVILAEQKESGILKKADDYDGVVKELEEAKEKIVELETKVGELETELDKYKLQETLAAKERIVATALNDSKILQANHISAKFREDLLKIEGETEEEITEAIKEKVKDREELVGSVSGKVTGMGDTPKPKDETKEVVEAVDDGKATDLLKGK